MIVQWHYLISTQNEITVMDNCSSLATQDLTVSKFLHRAPVYDASDAEINFDVTITVEDGNGNSASCIIPTTIDDATPPVVDCESIADVTVATLSDGEGDCAALVPDITALVDAVTHDNCVPNAELTFTQNPAAGSDFPSQEKMAMQP